MDGLGRPDSGTAHGVALLMGMEEPGDHVHTAVVDLRRLGVLIGVDEIAAEGLDHYLVGFRFHPRGDETGQVQGRVPVEVQLVVDQLVGGTGRHAVLRQLVARHGLAKLAGPVHGRQL